MIEDPPAVRLRRCLEVIEESQGLPDWMQREAVECELEEVADILEAASTTLEAPAVALCGRKDRGGARDTCDRPEHHHGECSWAAAKVKRRAAEQEALAAEVPKLRNRVATLTAKLSRAEREVQVERLRDRAQRSGRERRRAEQRG